jgi:CubicO group peptidase (beta-lactamase class C family)
MAFTNTEKLIQTMLEHQIAPGADYSFIYHGKIVRDVTRGDSEVTPNRRRLKLGEYFDVASLTKVMGTVPLMLLLQQEGRVDFDAPVHDYLPRVNDKRVTVRHLLTHTSGATAWIDHRDDLNASQLREAIYENLSFGPDFNQKVVYNDYNFLLLGFIIERILHVPVQVAIQKFVLTPMGLKASTFSPNPEDTVPTEIRNGTLTKGQVHDPKAASLGLHAGSAGLFATKHDVVEFTLKMLADENEILNAATLKQLEHNQSPNPALLRSWGWAFITKNEQQILLRHSGFTGTFILFDRLTQNGLVFLSNRVHPQPNLEFLDYRQKIYQTFAKEDF